jgi:hypothetical protein
MRFARAAMRSMPGNEKTIRFSHIEVQSYATASISSIPLRELSCR